MARRPDKREQEILSEEHLKELRYGLAHLSLPASPGMEHIESKMTMKLSNNELRSVPPGGHRYIKQRPRYMDSVN